MTRRQLAMSLRGDYRVIATKEGEQPLELRGESMLELELRRLTVEAELERFGWVFGDVQIARAAGSERGSGFVPMRA